MWVLHQHLCVRQQLVHRHVKFDIHHSAHLYIKLVKPVVHARVLLLEIHDVHVVVLGQLDILIIILQQTEVVQHVIQSVDHNRHVLVPLK